jgi:hypothetical protein
MPDQNKQPMETEASDRLTPTGQPMHPHDRHFYLLIMWAGSIPGALAVGCYIAWASGQMSWQLAAPGVAIGVLGMASATIYVLKKRPPDPRHPGPMVFGVAGAAVLTWALVAWQAWMWFNPSIPAQSYTHGYTQAQLDDAITKARDAAAKPLQDKLDQASKDTESLRQSTAKQIADAVAKVQAQSDTPVNVDRLPTSLRLLFKLYASGEGRLAELRLGGKS